ncbi:MAG: class II aldolase/adducin family protein [Thermomicrobiales bacterium]
MSVLSERVQSGIDPVEAAIRRDLAACYRLVALFGWDDMTATHISARLPGEGEVFLINPYGMFFEEITASSLIKINAEGDILEPTSYPVNRAGFVIHSAIHMVRQDAGCVIHLHTRDGMAVSALQEGLLPLTQTAMVLMNDITYHEYEGVALRLEERERLQKDLGDKDLMILRNHGTLAVGRTVREAFRRISLLETACTAQVAALSMGRPIHFSDPEVATMTAREYTPKQMETSAERAWPGLIRKLDRVNPGYSD